MAYRITVQDGPVTVTVETDTADDAAAVLAVSVLQKVQRSKSLDPPSYPWSGPDRGGGYQLPPSYPPGTISYNTNWDKVRSDAEKVWEAQFLHNPFTTSST